MNLFTDILQYNAHIKNNIAKERNIFHYKNCVKTVITKQLNVICKNFNSIFDLPTLIVSKNGIQYTFWCKYGKIGRKGDTPSIVTSNGYKYWYKFGLIHSTEIILLL